MPDYVLRVLKLAPASWHKLAAMKHAKVIGTVLLIVMPGSFTAVALVGLYFAYRHRKSKLEWSAWPGEH